MSEQREDLESARKHHRPRGTVSVYQQKGSGNWWVQNYRNGKPYRESARTTDRRKAEKFLQKRQAEVAGGNFLGPRIERILVSELAEDLLRDYRINGRKSLAGLSGGGSCMRNHSSGLWGRPRSAAICSIDT